MHKNMRILPIVTWAIIILAMILSYTFSGYLDYCLRKILNSKLIIVGIWFVSVATVITDRIYSKDAPANAITKHFGKFADTIYLFATLGVGGSTSVVMIKGLYFQYFDKITYFKDFTTYDIISVGIVATFLLFYVCLNIVQTFKNFASLSNSTETKAAV